MFNVRPKALTPWLHVEPPPAEEVPGFRMNPDGSVRDTQRDAAFSSSGSGRPRYGDAIQPLAQPVLGFLAPSPDFLARPALGLAQIRPVPQHDVLGFNFGPLEDVAPGLNLLESGSGLPRQEPPWFGATPPAPPQYSDAASTPTPPTVQGSTQSSPSQLPEWLYKVVTMPVPQPSTAFDPRTGRRIVPYEPLIGPIRSYLKATQNVRGKEDVGPYVGDKSPPPDLDFRRITQRGTVALLRHADVAGEHQYRPRRYASAGYQSRTNA